MYKFRGNLFVKIIAVLLFTVFTVSCLISAMAAMYLYYEGGYNPHSYEQTRNSVLSGIGYDHTYSAGNRYLNGVDPDEIYAYVDFRFEIYEQESNELIYSNYKNEEIIWSGEATVVSDVRNGFVYNSVGMKAVDSVRTETPEEVADSAQPPETDTLIDAERRPIPTITPAVQMAESTPIPTATPEDQPLPPTPVPTAAPTPVPTPVPTVAPSEDAPILEDSWIFYNVKGYFLAEDEYPQDVVSYYVKAFDFVYQYRYELIWAAVISLLLAIGCFIFLLFAAGRRAGREELVPNLLDKVPYDIFTAAAAILFCCMLALALEMSYHLDIVGYVFFGIFILIAGELALAFILSTAARIKMGGIIKSCICYKILAWFWKIVKTVFVCLFRLLCSVPLVKKGVLIFAAVLLVEFIWLMSSGRDLGMHLFGWFVERIVFGLLLIYCLLCMKKLKSGAQELAKGNEEYRVDTKYMKGEFLSHAEDLNSIGDGITKAVNERMKSERFKTELITNVSHDIKTPLTSIVNYVDLLEKEQPENEKMREYIEVLSRQSGKLKKLIEDLIEASKASTGNLAVNFEHCELGVLLDQTAGEYGEKLHDRGLELVLTKPEEPIVIQADGRHMWRTFDNLMNNICKYAQPNTRVYLSLERKEGKAVITFRNISGTQLNISGEELMERFVRGDASRNTEGSGLGLSIAKSLVQLQKGEMRLIVDGDLFKTELVFNEIK